MAGLGTGINYGVHANNLKNLTRGIVERVFHVVKDGSLSQVPQPKGGVFGRLSSIRQRLVSRANSTPVVQKGDYPYLYTGRKRRIYQRAYDSLCTRALRISDSFVSTFLKAEKINFTSKADPAPRVIQPRTPRFNLEVGCYLKEFEKVLLQAFCLVFGYYVVLKGMNANRVAEVLRGHWERYKKPVAFGLDASRFDQHVSVDALKWEHSVYNYCYQDKHLARLLRMQLTNRGYARVDGKVVRYEVSGKRMSGDINTGLGNCLLMSSMVLSYIEEHGIDARLANNGDDCVIVCEQSDYHKFDALSAWMLDFGFTITREEPVTRFERIEFCQAQPVYTSTGWRMVRNPFTAMAKDCVSLQSWSNPLEVRYWAHTIGTCGLELTRGVPIWEAWYTQLHSVGVAAPPGWCEQQMTGVGMGFMARGVVGGVITDEVRVSFYHAFGVMPDQQTAVEMEYANTPVCVDADTPVMSTENIKTLDRATNPLAILRDYTK